MVLNNDALYGRRKMLDSQAPDSFSHMATRNWEPVTIAGQSNMTMMVSFMDHNLTRVTGNAVKHFLLSSPEITVRDWCLEMSELLESGDLTRAVVDATTFAIDLEASTGAKITAIMNLPWSEDKPSDIYPIAFVLRMS